MPTQQQIDFSRGEQLAMIRDAKISPPSGSRVSSPAAKLVLRTIDDFGRGRECYATQERIAESCGMESRQIRRTIAALEAMSLLIVELKRSRDNRVVNHYRIVWSELALLATQTPRHEPTDRTSVSDRNTPTDRTFEPTDRTFEPTDRTFEPTDRTCMSDPYNNRLRNEVKRIRNEGQATENFFFDDDQRLEAHRIANDLQEVIPIRTAEDLSLVAKVATLAAIGEISEEVMARVINGIKATRPRNAAAYLHTSLDAGVGGELNSLLRRVPYTPPRHVLEALR